MSSNERNNMRGNLFNSFGDDMKDGRLTEPSNGKEYRLREAIIKSQELGRTLTSVEMEEYEVTTGSELLSELDKGIDDMEQGRTYSHEETMKIVREKLSEY
ncbi:MAG: hypothetical protein PHX08_09230 [Lachnospiraceae bacterium]|nr:hypothetical protein [Lachnospiraceae bacterium]